MLGCLLHSPVQLLWGCQSVTARASLRASTNNASASWAWAPVGALALAAMPVSVLLVMGYRRRWIGDDAYIDLRIVRNLLDGYGPVYNVGERVEAYTNPLWVALLAVWSALLGRPETGAWLMGLIFSAVGVLTAQAAGALLALRSDPSSGNRADIVLPLGSIAVAAVPVVWDFTTSGLESGLIFGWLGVAYMLVVRRCLTPSQRLGAWLGVAFFLGLGPLLRPDMALYSAGFGLTLGLGYALGYANGWGRLFIHLTVLLAAGGFLPAVYQVFRMGFFASLVPGTALAKEAGLARPDQGLFYARDFVSAYELWLPLIILLGWRAITLRDAWCARDWIPLALLASPTIAAALHTLYVVWIGGDFMHGRLLLPAFFAAIAPVSVMLRPHPGTTSWRELAIPAIMGLVLAWAVICGLRLRATYNGRGVVDERGVYVQQSGRPNPVDVDDYADHFLARDGRFLRERANEASRSGSSVLAYVPGYGNLSGGEPRILSAVPTLPVGVTAVGMQVSIGLTGYTAGPSVRVIDRPGLSDPIAARMRLEHRGRPGHEKSLPDSWLLARYAAPTSAAALGHEVIVARRALGCGEIRELLRAVEEPLSVERFMRNIALAPSLHRLRIPPDPAEAEARFCST